MKNMMKRLMAFAAAGAMAFCMTACDNNSSSSNTNNSGSGEVSTVKGEDMEYGATITQLKADSGKVKVSIEYDYRFLEEEEIVLVSDYIEALNTADAELMEATVYPDYLQYSVKQGGYNDTASYLEIMHRNIQTTFAEGGPFDFNYIVVDECYTPDNELVKDRFETLDASLKNAAGEDLSSKITSKKMIGIDIMFSMNGEGSYSLAYRQGFNSYLYIYEIDGELYIL